MIRAFFAIALPKSLHESISDLMQQLHEHIKFLKYRFQKLDHLHITLQFMKEVRLDDIPAMIEEIREKLKNVRAFEIELNQIELFPNTHHPRYISLIPTVNATLNTLVEQIGEVIAKAHYPIETRPYRPHMTLARLYENPDKKINFDNDIIRHKKIYVNEIIFYQSNPSNGETHYIPLERIKFE